MMILRKFKIPLILSIVLSIMMLSTHFVLADDNMATVIANEGIVRNKPEFEGEVIEALPIGAKVLIKEDRDDWYNVVSADSDITGWIYKDILIPNSFNDMLSKKGAVNVSSVLNFRTNPSTSGKIISQLRNGTEVTILAKIDQWYQIELIEGTRGFVHNDYIVLQSNFPHGKILNDHCEIKEKPSNESKTVMTLNKNKDIYIKKYEDGWYNIITDKFQEGWIKDEMVELQINLIRPLSRSGTRSYVLSDIKECTEKYLGRPYKYASAGPDSFDCSGFVYYILSEYYSDYLKNKGITLQRSSRDQVKMGTTISKSQLQPGDIVFFNSGTSSNISHVGIYIGDNQFIHSSSTNHRGVRIDSLKDGTSYWAYQNRYVTAIRL